MNDDITPQAAVAIIDTADGAVASGRPSLWERGLTTVEYAVGIVLVITIVGLLIAAAQQGWFMELVKALVGTIFRVLTTAIMGG